MDTERIARMKAELKRSGLDALVLRLPENVVMALGVWPMNGFSFALVTREAGPAALLAPSCENEEMDGCWAEETRLFTWPRLSMGDPAAAIREAFHAFARKHQLDHARIGYEGAFECAAPAHNAGEAIVPCESSNAFLKSLLPKAKWSDATALLYRLRATKTEAEIARLRLAHKVAGHGLAAFHEAVRPGITEAELAAVVYRECLVRGVATRGVRHVNVYPQVSSGPNAHRAWRPVVSTGRRRRRPGESAVLELAVCVDGFWADVTRVRAAGRPSTIQRRAFEAVQAAQAAAVQAIRAGVKASVPHEVATQILVEAGFADQIVHLTGHGLGFRYHEPEPFLMPGNDAPLRVGHVCSVEPGLYDPAWGGIRLEDNVAVAADGAEVLTKTPKRL